MQCRHTQWSETYTPVNHLYWTLTAVSDTWRWDAVQTHTVIRDIYSCKSSLLNTHCCQCNCWTGSQPREPLHVSASSMAILMSSTHFSISDRRAAEGTRVKETLTLHTYIIIITIIYILLLCKAKHVSSSLCIIVIKIFVKLVYHYYYYCYWYWYRTWREPTSTEKTRQQQGKSPARTLTSIKPAVRVIVEQLNPEQVN